MGSGDPCKYDRYSYFLGMAETSAEAPFKPDREGEKGEEEEA
jgi:hypothetical protein